MDRTALERILGVDADRFPATRLIDPHPAVPPALDRLVNAVERVLGGDDPGRVRDQLQFDSLEEIRAWFIGIAQWSGKYRAMIRGSRTRNTTGGPAYPTSLRYPILERDGFRCRYCTSRVVCRDEYERISSLLKLDSLISGSHNNTRHPLRMTTQATFDHVIPSSDGGSNDMSNLVASCWPCNFGKAHFRLEELGLLAVDAPNPPPVDDWDGLRRVRKPHRR
jgi:5-methylcytosine-specific restriction endonuclease McrA